MTKQLPTDEDGEVRELAADDFKYFKPASKVLPPELMAVLPRRGRPTVESPKKTVNILWTYYSPPSSPRAKDGSLESTMPYATGLRPTLRPNVPALYENFSLLR